MSATYPHMEKAQNIDVKRVKVHSPSQLPSEYGTTPGGTMFATTPGGTRIIYERAFLLECRNSPLAQSPLSNLPKIPGVTCDLDKGSPRSKKAPTVVAEKPHQQTKENIDKPAAKAETSPGPADDPQFHMDM